MIRPIAIVLMTMAVGSGQAAPVAREDLERWVAEMSKRPPSQVTVENVEFDGPYPMVGHDGRQRATIRMRGRLINRGTTTVDVHRSNVLRKLEVASYLGLKRKFEQLRREEEIIMQNSAGSRLSYYHRPPQTRL